eukprot:CAMPEP_0171070964 /NCGR_PEP_ID=MMETSP0766_2-20121228/10057_1 /TAXON_ID=439317 /ORGANISM="Gambierdiscus australes, Strain CAWD 149" /LENGTH=342 /DNA_ID=CAMNT_0011527487 /DNA_START=73 /DNA_END=1098 /DNA_ORIENTATION=-
MREGQARRIAAVLLLCVPGARGLRKVDVAELEPRAEGGFREEPWCDKSRDDALDGEAHKYDLEAARAALPIDEAPEPPLLPYQSSFRPFVDQCFGSLACRRAVVELGNKEKGFTEKRRQEQRRVHVIHRLAVYLYTHLRYTKINKYLRFPSCVDQECKDEHEEVYHNIRVLMSAISVGNISQPGFGPLPLPPVQQFLFRGSRELMPVLRNRLKPGFEFQEEGFMSTTASAQVAMECGNNWIMKILCDVGAATACQLYGRTISKFSKYEEETEVIFPPGMAFRILWVDLGKPHYITVQPLLYQDFEYPQRQRRGERQGAGALGERLLSDRVARVVKKSCEEAV